MYTPIQLDKSRNFRYGMKSISIIEKKFKKNISKINFDDLTMEETAILIWAGLVHEDKNLTPDKVMDLVDEYGNLQEVLEAMGEAFSNSFGGNDGKETEKKQVEGSDNNEFSIEENLEVATLCGISISEFWDITPYELSIVAKTIAKKREEDTKEKITLAYMNSLWTIQWLGKKHPKPLQKILDNLGKEKTQITDEQLLERVKMLNAMFGGEIIE